MNTKNKTLQAFMQENYTYLKGSFYFKNSDPENPENWIEVDYTPISMPFATIYGYKKEPTHILLNKLVFLYFNGDFDGKAYTVENIDKNKFNTEIENLRKVEKKAYKSFIMPEIKKRDVKLKKEKFPGRKEFVTEKEFFHHYFEIIKNDTGNLYLVWKLPTRSSIQKGNIAGTSLSPDERYPNRYPTVTLLGTEYPCAKVIWTMMHHDVASGFYVINKDRNFHNNRIENLDLHTRSNMFYKKLGK